MSAGALDPALVAPLLGPEAARWRLTGGGVTGSTNDDARALAADGDPGPTVVLAAAQTAGRGRFERGWESPPGGVYFSLLVRPDLGADAAGPLPLVAGLGIAAGLEARYGVRPTLKWPNDLLLPVTGGERGKLAGILAESAVSAGRLEWAVIGCGIDVLPPEPPAERAPGAAYFADAAAEVTTPADLPAVAAAALDGLAGALDLFVASGFEALAAGYEAHSDIIGSEVTVRDPGGLPIASGTVTGFDGTGRLVLDSDGREQRIAAGEVTLRS